MSVVIGHDCIHANISHLPAGQAVGYTTGSADIRWTNADWNAHPGAVRIDQDFAASDPSADCLDVERGAATPADCPAWAIKAMGDFTRAARPGQRTPAIYFSASSVHDVANALVAGGVKSGVGFWIAEWDLGNAAATADIRNAAGPFPIVAVQYSSGAFYDTNVFSGGWLSRVSVAAPVTGPPYVHHTDGVATLAAIAASRNMKTGAFLAEQARQYQGQTAALAALNAVVPPKGVAWFTDHP